MNACEHREICGFFRKYGQSGNAQCKMVVGLYCMGTKKSECRREAFRLRNGKPPVEYLMPNGTLMAC